MTPTAPLHIPHEPLQRRCPSCKRTFSPSSPAQKYCNNPCRYQYRKPSAAERLAIREALAIPVHCASCDAPFLRSRLNIIRCPLCASRGNYSAPLPARSARGDLFLIRQSSLPTPSPAPTCGEERRIIRAIERLPDDDPAIPRLQARLEAIWAHEIAQMRLKLNQ
jgi:Zn finger protein HypA/HybF involved in hydrogenase expression